ncbi:MAG: LysM peptidoglycan-binding domain-containing protein [Desulfuromonadaceae bacterium]|nr:LysM peptidoglycan-binding domain-containing protein [Desulfuromonadaceae bacterium]
MARAFCSILLLTGLLWGCASPPRQELLTARTALARAAAAEAQVLAADEYRTASNALQDGEVAIRRKKYKLARQILPLAEAHAQKALVLARQEQAQREHDKAQEREAEQAAKLEAAQQSTSSPPPKKKVAAIPRVVKPAPKSPQSYRVRGGETLWTIAARHDIYADALLWPLIYQANRDQIKDPRQIYPQQTLTIPRQISDEDQLEARQRARESKIFPIGELVR